ncbi:MAG TPA: hypothetical protein VF653_03220, partial [Methylomirabilota bacterium]
MAVRQGTLDGLELPVPAVVSDTLDEITTYCSNDVRDLRRFQQRAQPVWKFLEQKAGKELADRVIAETRPARHNVIDDWSPPTGGVRGPCLGPRS